MGESARRTEGTERMRSRLSPIQFVLAVVVSTACAGPSWEQVRTRDNSAEYRRYIADHPRSSHTEEARERLAVLQLERDPNLEALERFREEHADSTALPELMRRVEASAFEAARGVATNDAYERFLAAFPNGALAARASGNQLYLQEGGFAGRPERLATFLREHPESDYAAEAQRTLAGLDARQRTAFGRIGLEIEIAPGVAEANRLRASFSERAREIYDAAGLRLVDGPADAVLRIRHDEHPVSAHEGGDLVAKPGVIAETEVSLLSAGGEPIFQDHFGVRIADADRRHGESALFAPAAASYWQRFYVPIASWPTSAAHRSSSTVGGTLSGVGGGLGRAIALTPDGGFRVFDLSDPASPRAIGGYAHRPPAARFTGARVMGDRVVLFGEDGVEVVAQQDGGYRSVASFDRGNVGAVYAVEGQEGRLLMAGTRGLVRAPLGGGPVERLIERPLRGMARVGDVLQLLDDQWLYAGPISDPRATAFFTVADVGRALEPRLLRVEGTVAVVVGSGGVATFALSGTGPARPLARLRESAVGAIADAVVLGNSAFLLGERGLLVIDPRSGRILDSVDVAGRSALCVAGGQVIAIGGDRLDVVDATPWTATALPAAIEP